VVVHVEAESLGDLTSDGGGTLDDGTALPRATFERLACDAAVELSNLLSLCRRHHRFVHEFRFRIEVDGSAGFKFFRASGFEVTPSCEPPSVEASAAEVLRSHHRRRGSG